MLVIAFLVCSPLIALWLVCLIAGNVKDNRDYRRLQTTQTIPVKRKCPPVSVSTPPAKTQKVPKRPASMPETEPDPKTIFRNWVDRNKVWLLAQLEQKSTDTFLIEEKRIGDCSKEILVSFLMNDNRTETVWSNEDGVHVRLNRITV